MAWETRGGKSYFYRKKRIGGKVRSEYVGTGEGAALSELCDNITREENEIKRNRQKRKRAKSESLDGRINELSGINRNLVDALFLANGFHQHKRQWRKKRNGRTEKK